MFMTSPLVRKTGNTPQVLACPKKPVHFSNLGLESFGWDWSV